MAVKELVAEAAPRLVGPLKNWYVLPVVAGAVSTTEPPWQKVVGPPAVSVAVGVALIVTCVVAEVAAQPLAAATVLVTV